MTFNGADKSNSICAKIDFLLFGDSSVFNTEFSITDRTREANEAWDEAVTVLYTADPNHKWDDTTNTDLPFATLDLTASQDHYTLLDSALVIHRVRIKDRNGVFKTLSSALRSELSDSELNDTGDPSKYYKIGGMVFPVPVPDYGCSDGIELEFQRGANHFAIDDTEDSPGFNSQFHKFLAFGAALNYAIAQGMSGKIQVLMAEKERIKKDMQKHYQIRSPDLRPSLRLKPRSVNNYGL